MASPSPLSTIGEEIVRIIAPVSICMLLVVLLVSTLSSSSFWSSSSLYSSSSSSSSFWDNLETAVLTSVTFVVTVTLLTFVVLLLFYYRFTTCLRNYTALSASLALLLLGGHVFLSITTSLSLPFDVLTFSLLLLNLSLVSAFAATSSLSSSPFPIAGTQAALVLVAALIAYWLSMLPEWTTWALLVAMALYDLAAVLLPMGPLRLLVELAISRDEDLPALVYEARPVLIEPRSSPRRTWRSRGTEHPDLGVSLLNSNEVQSGPGQSNLGQLSSGDWPRSDAGVDEAAVGEFRLELPSTMNASVEENEGAILHPEMLRGGLNIGEVLMGEEGIGLGVTGAIKLGLGDFIFYSMLVGRAAMYDYMTVYACYLAIVAGLGITLLLLAFYRKALPALPVSIALGVMFYFVTRALLEVFVMQCSVNLVMF